MSTVQPVATGTPFWAGRAALVMPAILVGIAVFLGVGVARMQVADDTELFGPKAFPVLTILALVVLAVLLTVSILRNPEVADPAPVVPASATEETGEDSTAGETAPAAVTSNWRALAITVGSVAVFIALLETAGWIIAAAVLFTGVATGLGSRRYLLNVGVGLAISSVVQLVFVGLLGLSLPPGIMGVF